MRYAWLVGLMAMLVGVLGAAGAGPVRAGVLLTQTPSVTATSSQTATATVMGTLTATPTLSATLTATATATFARQLYLPLLDNRDSRLVSLTAEANGDSYVPAISDDGSTIAFISEASNLAATDGNARADVYVWRAGQIRHLSGGLDGAAGDGAATAVAIAGGGRYVAFISTSSNLVTNDTNGVADAFVYDLATGVLEVVSVGMGGVAANRASTHVAVAPDGSVVYFTSDSTNLTDVPLQTGCSFGPCPTYTACARPPCPTLYSWTRATGMVQTVLREADGRAIGPVGRLTVAEGPTVLFEWSHRVTASSVGPFLYHYNSITGHLRPVASSRIATGNTYSLSEWVEAQALSPDGEHMGYFISEEQYNPDFSYCFNRDFYLAHLGTPPQPIWSDVYCEYNFRSDGVSGQPTLALARGGDVVVYNVSDGIGTTTPPDPSDTNEVADVFRWEEATNDYRRLSRGLDGMQANGPSGEVAISGNGRVVVFTSAASNLVVNDANGRTDIFVWTLVR